MCPSAVMELILNNISSLADECLLFVSFLMACEEFNVVVVCMGLFRGGGPRPPFPPQSKKFFLCLSIA